MVVIGCRKHLFWYSRKHGNNRNSATGATTGVLTTVNATWFITGIQLEVGSSASDFEHRSIVEELNLCYRYFIK